MSHSFCHSDLKKFWPSIFCSISGHLQSFCACLFRVLWQLVELGRIRQAVTPVPVTATTRENFVVDIINNELKNGSFVILLYVQPRAAATTTTKSSKLAAIDCTQHGISSSQELGGRKSRFQSSGCLLTTDFDLTESCFQT